MMRFRGDSIGECARESHIPLEVARVAGSMSSGLGGCILILGILGEILEKSWRNPGNQDFLLPFGQEARKKGDFSSSALFP